MDGEDLGGYRGRRGSVGVGKSMNRGHPKFKRKTATPFYVSFPSSRAYHSSSS